MRSLYFIIPLIIILTGCVPNRVNEMDERNKTEHNSMMDTIRRIQEADSTKIEQLQRDMVFHRQSLMKFSSDIDALRSNLDSLIRSPLMQLNAVEIDTLKAQVIRLNSGLTNQSDQLKFTSDRISTILDETMDNTRRVLDVEGKLTLLEANQVLVENGENGSDKSEIVQNIRKLQTSLSNTDDTIKNLTLRLNDISGQLQSVIADPNVKVNPDVRTENFSTQFTEFRTQLNDLREYVRKLEGQVNSSLVQKDKGTAEQPLVKIQKPSNEVKNPPSAPTPSPAKQDADAKALYDKARNTYESRHLDTAANQFKDFLSRYPQHELAGNSQYWLGETYYAAEEYTKAIEELQKVADYYPSSPKAPDALLKIGLSYQKLGDRESAKRELEKIRRLYPDYERQNLVDKYLSTLK